MLGKLKKVYPVADMDVIAPLKQQPSTPPLGVATKYCGFPSSSLQFSVVIFC